MRICLVYDCLYPYTVGGAERWYRNLAERLAEAGHEVTYLTLRQWDAGEAPRLRGARVVAVGPRLELYASSGRRRILPPIRFGAGVLRHLLAKRGRYDVVHTASFPYFSLLAAAAARPPGGYRIVVDWHEVWTREYWRDYLGPLAGLAGWLVQRLTVRIGQRAFCFSRLHARRLAEEGYRGPVTVLEGEYAGSLEPPSPRPAEPVVVFAGRHIPEKRPALLVPAVARARERIPELRCEIYGDGPERPRVTGAVEAAGLEEVIDVPGFVDEGVVDGAIRRALCTALPSRREGYGLVVVESAARGTPSVVVAGLENAATELVADGENGVIARSAEPQELARAIVRVHEAGMDLRRSTCEWFARNAERLSLGRSLQTVVAAYAGSGDRSAIAPEEERVR